MPTTLDRKTSGQLGGKTLLGSSPLTWTLKAGVQPHVQMLDIAPVDALELAKNGGPFTLEIVPPEGNPVKVNHLWVLNVQPGPSPWISKITVADRRWMWSYSHILRRYNMRRTVGVKRLIANDKVPEVNPIGPLLNYWQWSLENGKRRWVPVTMLKDALKAVADSERDYTGSGFEAVIDQRIGQNIAALPVEDLEVDDAGDQAINRLLSYLPEAAITVDYDGKVNVYSRVGGDEAGIVSALMPELAGQGHTDLVENSRIRPREIHVLFTPEVEVRHNFIEVASAQNATVTADPLGDRREMENVLPIPDYQLTVGGQTLPQGTWITVDQAFVAWGDLPLVGATIAIDHAIVQRAFVPHNDLWAALQLAGQRPDNKGTLANWVGRIASIEPHYRRTFRLNPRWVDRSLTIKAKRVGTIDPSRGQRGPALAYSDYAIMYTQRSIWRNNAQGQPLDFCINKTGYADIIDSTAVPSPAEVSVIDPDQGIIKVDYVLDPNRVYEMILPSQIVLESMPTSDITQRTRNITFDSVITANNAPRLSPSFKLATILTHVPASPNTSKQLYKIVIKPADVVGMVPPAARAGILDSRGPIMEIRIGPNIETARVAWNDARSADIEKLFGITEGPVNLEQLVVNDGPSTNLDTGGSLRQIALSRAACVYAALTDRYEGSMTGYMNGGVHLNGWVEEIEHGVTPKGEPYTKVSMPSRIPQMSLASFLDSNTRAAIFHLIRPEGK